MKTYVISGAHGSMLSFVVHQLLQEGHRVIALYRNAQRAQEGERFFHHPHHHAYVMDLAKVQPNAIADFSLYLSTITQSVDVVVHGAGLTPLLSPLAYYPPDVWQEIFHLHVHAVFWLTQGLAHFYHDQSYGLCFAPETEELAESWGAYAVACEALKTMASMTQQAHGLAPLHVLVLPAILTRRRQRLYPVPPEDILQPKQCVSKIAHFCQSKPDTWLSVLSAADLKKELPIKEKADILIRLTQSHEKNHS